LIDPCKCTFLDIHLCHVYFACSSCSWWFWVCLWITFWTLIRTFWSTHWSTFWSNFLNFRNSSWIQCPLISCILVWFKPCSCLSKNTQEHKYQKLSKFINLLITIDVFNDFLIQSQNHCLHKICSCHIYSCIFLVWTLILWVFSNEPSEQPSELLLSSYIWTSECFFWVPSFLTVVLYAEHDDVIQHFEPYESCFFIPFKNYLKHIKDRSFVLTNKMILSLKSKRIFLCIIACNQWLEMFLFIHDVIL